MMASHEDNVGRKGWGSARQAPVFAICACVFAFLAIPASVHADDGASIGLGGAMRLMHGHPSIRMVSEEVHIKLPEEAVDARFVFKNEGPATTVRMGFPDEAGGEGAPEEGGRLTRFDRFASYVDGQPVKVKRVVGYHSGEDEDYDLWWVKQVHFDRGQTRVVENRYASRGSNNDDDRWFVYVLTTGASWKGPIGHAHIVCDIHDIRNVAPLTFSPRGYRRVGDTVVWDFTNFKPKKDIEIHWLKGFLNISVNGRPVGLQWYSNWGIEPPRRQGDRVWISFSTAAAWLGGHLHPSGPGDTVRLSRGNRWVEARFGSAVLRGSNGNATMLQPAHCRWGTEDHTAPASTPESDGGSLSGDEEGSELRVSLAPLVRLLGGTTRYDTRKNWMYVWLK